jgi:hypothetical protein
LPKEYGGVTDRFGMGDGLKLFELALVLGAGPPLAVLGITSVVLGNLPGVSPEGHRFLDVVSVGLTVAGVVMTAIVGHIIWSLMGALQGSTRGGLEY